MNEQQRDIYLLLCITGRTQEALTFREKCEKEKENMDGNAVNALIEPMGDDV